MARELRLASRRMRHAKQFKPPVLAGSVLRVPPVLGSRYAKELEALVARMAKGVKRDAERLFRSPVATESIALDASLGSQARIAMNGLTRRYTEMFARVANRLATTMVEQADRTSAASVAASLRELSGRSTLSSGQLAKGAVGEITKAAVAENVALIKSIPERYLLNVQGAVMRSITSGNGLQDLIPALLEQEGMTARRARNIALDQTRKTLSAVNAGRMKANGIRKFRWIHTGGGQKPRQDHMDMDGNIYDFDDLPVIDQRTGERGIPGQAPQCRCSMQPLLDFDSLPGADD